MRLLIGLLSLFTSLQIQAAPTPSPEKYSEKYLSVKEALLLPLENRASALRAQGAKGEAALTTLMFDEKASMDLRWKAITAAGLLKGNSLKPQLQKAIVAKEWFVRNAALVALESVDRNEAKAWAKKLLNDKALVVRSAAVETLSRLDDRTASSVLWKKLSAKENFRGNQSLWIRKQITQALAQLDKSDSHGRFVDLLEDRDEGVQEAAVRALEFRTGQRLGGDKEPVKFKRAYWQQWWRERQA